MKDLKEMRILKIELAKAKNVIAQVKTENVRFKQVINLNNFANDDLDLYNCRKNNRSYGIPMSSE